MIEVYLTEAYFDVLETRTLARRSAVTSDPGDMRLVTGLPNRWFPFPHVP
jgi:hypothetical protein